MSVYNYKGILRADDAVILEKGFFTLHAARRYMIEACTKASQNGLTDVSAHVLRHGIKVSEFSVLDSANNR